jgi:hypothetical protein
MGIVYRARDTRLQRDVAIKVLPPSVAGDDKRLARFEQEALAAAALNHPNILVVHDVGRNEGVAYVVAELLEGRTLRAVLDAGVPSIAKAIEYASQIAQGLAAAHARGIVHRDIKPENLFVTTDERVKILDFGLAKPLGDGGRLPNASASTALSPGTEPGMVLGTVGYMSPEQVRGEPADARSDLFSFGAVLHEMLTGRRAFARETAAESMTAILREPPAPISSVRAVPPALERVVARCLEKQPAARFQSASDLAFALQTLGSTTGSDPNAPRPVSKPARPAFGGWIADPRSLAALALAAVAAAWAVLATARAPEDGGVDRFPIRVEIGAAPVNELTVPRGVAALSRDGRTLVYLARPRDAFTFALFVRRLDQAAGRVIPGTEMQAQLSSVAFSPDEKSLVYVENRRRIMRRALDGGGAVELAQIEDFGGVDWSPQDEIVFGFGADQGLKGLYRVKASGGAAPVPLTQVDTARKELSHKNPRALDDGTVLFSIWYGSIEQAEIGATSLSDGKVVPLGIHGVQPLGVVGGQLVYTTADGGVMAVPFDARARRTTGTAVNVGDSIDLAAGGQPYLSPTGGLVFPRGTRAGRLLWLDRAGHSTPAIADARGFSNVRLSPDERQAALTITTGRKSDLWILDVAAGTLTPLTTAGTVRNPAWSSDSRRVLYPSTQGGPASLWWQPVDASGPAVKAADPPNNPWWMDLAPDGAHVAYSAIYNGSFNLEALALDGSKATIELAASPAADGFPRFSPDGTLIAYTSEESGTSEVYVRTFPDAGRVRVSVDGGRRAIWDADGKRLYYTSGSRMYVATIARDPVLRVVSRAALFNVDRLIDFDVTKDGRFLVIEADGPNTSLVVIPNWKTELQRLTSGPATSR